MENMNYIECYNQGIKIHNKYMNAEIYENEIKVSVRMESRGSVSFISKYDFLTNPLYKAMETYFANDEVVEEFLAWLSALYNEVYEHFLYEKNTPSYNQMIYKYKLDFLIEKLKEKD